MTTPDISNLQAADLLALKAAIDARLEEIRKRHVDEAAALGLTLVPDNGPKRKRKPKAKHDDATERP